MNNIIVIALGGLCIFFSCILPLPEKPSRFWQFIILICTLASACVLVYPLGQSYAFVAIAIVLFLIYLSTSQRWLNLSCALFGYLFAVSLDYICIWIAQRYLNMNLDQIYQDTSVIIPFSMIYCMTCFLCTSLLGYLLNTRLKISALLTDLDLCKTIFIEMLLLTVVFIFNFSYGSNLGYSYGVVAFNGILFLALFAAIAVLMWFLYRNIQQKQQAKSMLQQYEHLQAYTHKLEELYGSMRSFKHDYVNILSTLSGYMEKEDLPRLKDYFYNEILPLSQAFSESDTRLGTLSYIEILELKSLLSSKLIYAMELGIKVELELSEPVRELPMKSIDLARVMGIFLDNAIEAALASREMLIQLCFFSKEDCLIIILRNSSAPPAFPISQLTGWGISSKGEHRGVGLHNAKNILDQYDHVLWDMEYKDSFFTQTLTIYQKGTDGL